MGINVDGDQCTLVLVSSETYHPLFMPMVPTYAFIDRANGKFNRAMDFQKDYAAIISAAYDIDRKYDQFLTDPDADSYEALRSVGIDVSSSSEDMIEKRNKLIRDIMDGKITGSFSERFSNGFDMI